MSQVFLSYCLADEREAAVIRDELIQQGLNVWWDAELPVGKNWASEVGRALKESDCMVVLVSPHAMASDLVKRQLEHAITNRNFAWRLFPLLIRPTANLPGYFHMMCVFDVTKNRARGMKKLADAIKTKKNGPIRVGPGAKVRPLRHKSKAVRKLQTT